MMFQPTGIRILKNTGRMTGRGGKSQNASRQAPKPPVHGEKKIRGELVVIAPYHEHFVLGSWYGDPVVDAVKKSPSLIMRITKNLLKLCGFANPVISSGTKNLKKNSNDKA